MRMSFFWYDASSPVERCAHRRAGLAPVAVREGAGCGTDLESEEDDVGVAPEAYARGSLLDCLERILDLHGVCAHVSAESASERESECAGRVIWRAVGGGEDAHLVEAALGAEGRVVVVVRVAVHRAGRREELYEARGGALTGSPRSVESDGPEVHTAGGNDGGTLSQIEAEKQQHSCLLSQRIGLSYIHSPTAPGL